MSRTNPAEIGKVNVTRAQMLRYSKSVLENFFPKNWFSDKVDITHDAYVQWDICNKFMAHEGHVNYPQQAWMLPILSRAVINAFLLNKLTDGDTNRLVIGIFDYGQKRVHKKILSRFPDSEQFQDMLVELEIGAWHMTNSDKVTPLETEGLPDIEIEIAGYSDTMYVECKNLRSRDERRIADIVNKANAQLENTKSNSYGCLVIRVAEVTNLGVTAEGTKPPEVMQVAKVVESLLVKEQNRATSSVIIIWDAFQIMGQPPENVGVCYIRKSMRINHSNPKRAIPPNVKLFEAFSLFYRIMFKPSAR